ncbi:hypothetical protein [Streptomyces sp. NPDC050263]|uniref:hypothetical protein n=1 Tax=Streptomyces sp. NPDC050263 TaxID=3155037 RepID=UPI0034446A78
MSAGRTSWRRPALSPVLEGVVTGGSALLWYALATLLYLENYTKEPWDPDYPSERPFFLLACTAGASLLLTWGLRSLPTGRTGLLGRILDRATQVRAAAVAVIWAALVVAAIVT